MLSSLRHLTRRTLSMAATLGIVLLLTLSASEAKATACSPAKNYLGFEYVAVAGPNAAGEYFYRYATIRCQGGQIVFEPGVGLTGVSDAGWQLPQTVIDTPRTTFGTYTGYRIFGNTCGTNLIFIHSSFAGQIGGVNVSGYPASNTTSYTNVFSNPVYLQLGPDFPMAADPATGACTLRPDSGLNAGMCVAGVDNGLGSAGANGSNPINPAWRGNKTQRETDYQGTGAFPLSFARTYNSRATRIAGLNSGFDSAVAGVWTHTYQRSLKLFTPADGSGLNTVQSAAVYRPDGKIVVFNPSGANWVPATAHIPDTLTHEGDGSWRYTNAEDETETYSAAGRLTRIANPAGLTQTLSYDANDRLSQVADAFGRTLTLTYDTNGRLSTLTDPGNGTTQYAYDGQGNLSTATYPGAAVRTYHYENTTYPKALTGMTDENARRTATWAYDSQGRAISSEHGASNSGIDRHAVTYNANGSATLTDALGTARTFSYLDQFSTAKLAGASQPGGAGCGPAAQGVTYDSKGFVASRTDFNGNVTKYVRNARGLETSRTEAFGTALARTITTTWHATYRQPIQIDEPGRRTTFAYDTAGNRLTQTVTDTATGRARTWTWSYNAAGQVLTADGPRTDVPDQTTYTYYSDTTADHTQGDLATVTDALGHVTRITAYDKHGRPLTVIDPNTVTLTFTYTARGWLKTSSVGGQTTTYDYDSTGQLIGVTRPDASTTTYGYDDAHRLTSIGDTAANSVNFTLDPAGNVLTTTWSNPDGASAKTQSAQYDALGRLQSALATRNAVNYATTYGYDANGNRKTVTDAKNQSTTTQYDALNRPTQITDALSGLTTLAYDARDRLTQLKAPNNAQTSFTVDALGNVTQEVSAGRGTTNATYDDAGNLLTRTDARGLTETRTWDALNRPLSVSYPTTGENQTYAWDNGSGCTHGVGRLCRISDNGGSTAFAYDARGNVVSETRSEAGGTFTTQYSYDGADRIATLVTPTGKLLSVQRDRDGRVRQLSAAVGTNPQVALVSDLQTDAAGQVTAQTFGNGVSETRTYHADGSVAGQADTEQGTDGGADADVPTLPEWGALLLGTLLLGIAWRRQRLVAGGGNAGRGSRDGRGGLPPSALGSLLAALLPGLLLLAAFAGQSNPVQADEALTYDPNGNVVTRTVAGATTSYDYDALDRLKSEAGPQKTQTLTYDANGNRRSDASGNHTYTANSDRLLTIAGQSVSLDAAGNVTQARNLGFVWNQAGQLKEVHQTDPSGPLLASYFYDYKGRRTRKVTTAGAPQGAQTILYHYDTQDHLIAETTAQGNPLFTYVWRDEVPVSVIVHGTAETALYLEADHLDTPIAARDQRGKVVWTWASDAFGSTIPNEDPDGDGTKTTINLRFPGQYFEKESGLHYNMARYYDPAIGRYLSSDPVGIAGGSNTYSYVGGNPLGNIDPEGLKSWTIGFFPGVGAQITFGQNPNSSGFMSVQFGWGIGGGFTYNPLGQQPGYDECQGASWGVGTGVYGQAGFRAGPVGASIGPNLGRNFRSTGSELYGGLTTSGGLKSEISGINASVSGGGQVTVFGGGAAKGSCTCGR